MTRITVATLKPGQEVLAGYRRFLDRNEFIGFTSDETGMFDSDPAQFTHYATYAELKANVADESIHKATFRSLDSDGTWGELWQAYRWNGRWRVGSSADTLKLAPVEA